LCAFILARLITGHNLFFRGHRIIDAVFSYLQQNKMNAPVRTLTLRAKQYYSPRMPQVPYSKAFDIVLTGCSAGGLATFLHAGNTLCNPTYNYLCHT
jgi:hypothetical protein